MVCRNRTPSEYNSYGLYLDFSGLSLRRVSERLSCFCPAMSNGKRLRYRFGKSPCPFTNPKKMLRYGGGAEGLKTTVHPYLMNECTFCFNLPTVPGCCFFVFCFWTFFLEMLLKSYTLYSNEITFLYLLRGVFCM
jgi:hypothetical protein